MKITFTTFILELSFSSNEKNKRIVEVEVLERISDWVLFVSVFEIKCLKFYYFSATFYYTLRIGFTLEDIDLYFIFFSSFSF